MAFFFTAWGKSAPFGVGIEKPDQLERATPVFFFRIRDRPPPGREKVERPKTLFYLLTRGFNWELKLNMKVAQIPYERKGY